MDRLKAIEAECAASAVNPNTRVSLDRIEGKIVAAVYTSGQDVIANGGNDFRHPSLETLTICIVVLDNGFVVIGKSAPADPANYNPALGQKLAREDAIRQIWPLEGYALKERMHVTAEAEALRQACRATPDWKDE